MKISLLLILLAFFVMQAEQALYSVDPNFEISTTRTQNQLAYAEYTNQIYEKGWNYLHVYANVQKGLLQQHRGAGFLEGYITYKQIYSAYQNLVGSVILKGQQTLSLQAQTFVDQQIQYMQNMIKTHPRDIYWQYAEAYLQQLRFMYRGYLTRINIENAPSMFIGFSQFYYLTNVGDLEDLIPAFHDKTQMGSHADSNQKNNLQSQKGGNCNGFIKLIDNQLYFGHSTHNIYQFLLRIFKTYHFPTRNTEVGSQWFAFSSRPGDLISKDDFYVLSSGMVVMETSLSNQDPKNYEDLSPNTVPCWLRATIAVNLARNGTQWADYFLKARSGTHNNQWLVSDPQQLKKQDAKNVVTLIEQGFSQFSVVDMTQILFEKGYLGSYNVPFTNKIYHKLAYEKYPWTYENQPRAIQYSKYNPLINNIEDMKKWLIFNEYDNPKIGLAPRYDQADSGKSAFGLTDCKILTPQTLKQNYILAISGPSQSNGKYPAFDWGQWPNVPHYGMPKVWNFSWQKYPIINQQQEDYSKKAEIQTQ